MILNFVKVYSKIKIFFNIMKKSLLRNRKMHFFHYPNKRLLYSKFFTFLKKKIINKKFIYFSGGRSFLRIHEKINYE